MFRALTHHNKKRKRGFTLIECVVSIAIFAIMGTMFATFMVSSVRVVNLSIATEEDRELLLEAIATYHQNGSYESEYHDGKVTITAIDDATGKNIKLNLDLSFTDDHYEGDPTKNPINRKTEIQFMNQNAYLVFKTESGTQYCLYLGDKTKVPTIDETLDPNKGRSTPEPPPAGGNG